MAETTKKKNLLLKLLLTAFILCTVVSIVSYFVKPSTFEHPAIVVAREMYLNDISSNNPNISKNALINFNALMNSVSENGKKYYWLNLYITMLLRWFLLAFFIWLFAFIWKGLKVSVYSKIGITILYAFSLAVLIQGIINKAVTVSLVVIGVALLFVGLIIGLFRLFKLIWKN